MPPPYRKIEHLARPKDATEPRGVCEARKLKQVRPPCVNLAAVCAQPRREGVHVGGLGRGKEHDCLGAVDLAQEVVVRVGVKGRDGSPWTDPCVDALDLALPKGTVLWRLHTRATVGAVSYCPFLYLESEFYMVVTWTGKRARLPWCRRQGKTGCGGGMTVPLGPIYLLTLDFTLPEGTVLW